MEPQLARFHPRRARGFRYCFHHRASPGDCWTHLTAAPEPGKRSGVWTRGDGGRPSPQAATRIPKGHPSRGEPQPTRVQTGAHSAHARESPCACSLRAPPARPASRGFFPPASCPHFRGFLATAVSGGRKLAARPAVNGTVAPLPAGFRRRRLWAIVRRRRTLAVAGAMEMPLPPDGKAQLDLGGCFSLPGALSWPSLPPGGPRPGRGRGSASRARRRPLPRARTSPARVWPLSGPVQGRALRGSPFGTLACPTGAGTPGPPGLGGPR